MDRVALQWVHGEIIERLGNARISLEEFAEGSGELSSMRDCAEILHEIRGVFEMLEFHSVSLLMDEMESLSQQVIEQHIERSDEACEVLMRGIAQLPEYMEYVRTGQRDNPILLMPLLNDLRSVRGESLLSESALFCPALWVALPMLPGNDSVPDDESLRAELRRMRPFFQRGLVMWLTETEARAGSALMARVATRLVQFVGPSEARRLWWVAGAVLSALARGEIETNASLKRLVGRLDREIKALLDGGATLLASRPPTQLLKNLLYYVALARSQSVQHLAVREAFGLDGLLIALEDREGAARVIGGPSLEALRSVGDALKEDLSRVKDSLDTFVRNEEQPVSELTPQTDILNRVADTLGLLSLGGPRRAILNQAAAINRFRDGQVPPSHEELIEIARVLLNVDTTLDSLSEHGLDETMRSVSSVDAQSREMSHGGTQLTGIEYLQLLSTVLAECKADLGAVKDAIATFVIEPDDYERLEEIPGRLYNVEGSLEILSLGRARELLASWRDYVRVIFIERHEVPSPEMLDTLAETVISIEYYLDAVSQARPDSEEILERAAAGVARLVEATPADELRVLGPNALPAEGDLGVDLELELTIPAFILEDLQRAKALLDRIEPPATQVKVDSVTTQSVSGAFAALAGTGEEEQDSEVDPEIIAVFLEEAEQIHVDLAVDLSAWAERPQDGKLLITVRRAFHTLKGSGRIVGAKAVADFAWAVENMLNRVIDRIVPAAPSIVDVTREAFDVFPSLVNAFANPELETPNVSNLMSRAAHLARPKGHTAEGFRRHGHGDVAGNPLLGTTSGESESAEILSFPARHEARAREIGATSAQARADTDAPAQSNAGNSGEGNSGEGNSEEAQGRRVLGAVFVEEATGYLDALEALLREGEGNTTQRASAMHAPFMRIFHTLHGGARAAGMRDVANLAGALEDYLIGLRQEADNAVTPLGSAGLKLVRDAYHALRTSLHQRPSNEVGVVVGIEALLARIAILSSTDGASAMRHDATITGRSSVELEDARDRLLETMRGDEDLDLASTWDSSQLSDAERDELRQLFLEEAAELVDHADRTLTRWRANPSDLELVSALQRDIHTLKGGARVAGMNPVSDLSHALESVFMLVGERLLGASERLFDLLQSAHDRLAAALDKAAANETMPEVESLISALDGVVSPGVVDVDVAGLATSGLLAPVPDERVPDGVATNPAPTHARAALGGAHACEGERLDEPMALTAGRDARRDQVGVSADLLDEIVTHAGEISIAQ
ncbi:MAG: chemosensory pili system protein ChpA (sensor histidine kinase/response regulator), partial [Gammaproteobacteria bacterium]